MAKITGNFAWNKPEVYTSFVEGADAKAIYDSLEGSMRNGISYDKATKTLQGSNVFAAARIDSILHPLGIHVANLRDLSRPEVLERIKEKHYTDAPVLILRTEDDFYEPNLPIIKQLIPLIEEANGKLQLPAMITGFDVKTMKDKGYGIKIVPRDDFKAVSDKRLGREYSGKSFTEVDELGLPKFDSNGKRTWFARNQGVSRLYLNRGLDLYSDGEDLADSYGDGRVVLVSAEGASQKNLEAKLK